MLREFDLPIIEKNSEFAIYEVPGIDLGNGLIALGDFQIHVDSPDEPELILRQPEGSDVDMLDFLTDATKERIINAFRDLGIDVASATPLDSDYQEDEYIIHTIVLCKDA